MVETVHVPTGQLTQFSVEAAGTVFNVGPHEVILHNDPEVDLGRRLRPGQHVAVTAGAYYSALVGNPVNAVSRLLVME